MTTDTAKTIDLTAISNEYLQLIANRRVVICAGTGCVAGGALKLYDAFKEKITAVGGNGRQVMLKAESKNGAVDVKKSGCQGFCQMGPLVTVEPDNILYTRVKPDDVDEIINQTILQGEPVKRLLFVDPRSGNSCRNTDEIPFYTRQQRLILRDCGRLNPEDIKEYINHGGYGAARRAFLEMTPDEVVKQVEDSGLRGRGGGGFPTGRKWRLAQTQPPGKKYIICNGDEGDPGAFMDRSIMEGNPHSVIEGMMIAARAIGADEGYIYVRAEYPIAVARLHRAVEDARNLGLLGDNLFGSGLSFRLHVMEGAGAFVCGEETALMASIMGQRGMPNPKPPFPASSGLWGKPTLINNVETLATIPIILNMGSEAFTTYGTPSSPGTKIFALTGHVVNCGLIEVPFGATLAEIIFDIGGGVTDDIGNLIPGGFKAVQIGGPSGGCLTTEHLNLKLDFDSLREVGAMVGSGGLVVINKNTCMVEMARFFMQFTQNESCGKCVLCREGTRQMLSLLDDIMEGRGDLQTIETLEVLARAVQKASLCGLGKTAPNPVLTSLRYFREEILAHVTSKTCPAKRCKALLFPSIDETLCTGCTICVRKCPVKAITGQLKQPHHIDEAICIKCGACTGACKFHAISIG